MKKEILLKPHHTSFHGRFNTTAGNPVKKILLKLNLSDHRLFKDGGGVKEFQRSFRHSDTERLSRSDEVLKLKNFKKDATLKLFKSTNQVRYEHVGPTITSSQDGKVNKMAKRDYAWLMISSQRVVIPTIDDEETLILEEVSRSKMLAKQNDPMSKEKKVNTTPINYVELNRLPEDFGKRFVPQQELSAEQAFWLQTSHPNTDQSATSPVKIKAPKVSLVNTSLKKLKYQLGQFNTVVKKQITLDASYHRRGMAV
ncbi:hypothetical protein Tco_0921939 [Tanacetum coccineum]|uniref:Uncharacterized protein n=1 Tax=Tanacetum coccineum TaxID=301880 RepID=A0ABQ5CWQ5_9ASTR